MKFVPKLLVTLLYSCDIRGPPKLVCIGRSTGWSIAAWNKERGARLLAPCKEQRGALLANAPTSVPPSKAIHSLFVPFPRSTTICEKDDRHGRSLGM